MSPLRHLKRDDLPSVDEFLQKHSKEMTPEDKERVLARIAEQVKQRYGVDAKVADPPPRDGVEFVDGLNISRCIGCRYCEAACPCWARRFKFAEPQLTKDEINPEMGYLSNRPRSRGVMEKCTITNGRRVRAETRRD